MNYYNLECLVQNVRVRDLCSSENKEFTFVNDCFRNKKREEVGHYGQTLFALIRFCRYRRDFLGLGQIC